MLARRGERATREVRKVSFEALASVLCAASLCLALVFIGFVRHSNDEAVREVHAASGLDSASAVTEVKELEEPVPSVKVSQGVMPAYLQIDSRWAGIAYAGGTIVWREAVWWSPGSVVQW